MSSPPPLTFGLRTSDENALELYRQLVSSVKDYAILMLDPEGRVVIWNEGAQRIKGYTAEEILGQSFTRFYPEEDVAAQLPQRLLQKAARDGRVEHEGWRVRKDGSRFWADVVITAIRDAEGNLIGFGKVTRDLTARREAELQTRRLVEERARRLETASRNEELARLNQQLVDQAERLEAERKEAKDLAERLRLTNLELQAALAATKVARDLAERSAATTAQAYRDLDQFAYVASHDLKAPLRGIANLAQWIQEDVGDALTAESVEHMRLLQGRVHRMEALIDGILAYSRAGRRLNAPETVEVGPLVQEVIQLLAPPAGTAIKVDEPLPVVVAERVPLQQVFLNLIGNAVKYTGAARSDVEIRVACRDLGDVFEFAVRDNGPGIAPEFHERIWGIFQTLEARDKVEGTGIGLSVVKKLVETRVGTVSVESAPGQGATFRFTWARTARKGADA